MKTHLFIKTYFVAQKTIYPRECSMCTWEEWASLLDLM